MNKDIQTLIEREANDHKNQTDYIASQEYICGCSNENDKLFCWEASTACSIQARESFQAGAHFTLSLFKWRKVEDELPDVKNEAYQVLVYRKYKKEEYKMDTLWIIPDMSVSDSFKFYGVTEWMPIPNND